jgi:DNA-binding Xre family transcriptional regulator
VQRLMIVNRVPDLVAEKFGGKDKINIAKVERDTGLNYRTAMAWVKGRVERADFPTLEAWCNYLGCEVGDLLEYHGAHNATLET